VEDGSCHAVTAYSTSLLKRYSIGLEGLLLNEPDAGKLMQIT
jgi:hypothetical protein